MEQTIHFDNAREAQDLAGRGYRLLGRVETALRVRATARDLWLKLEGEPAPVAQAVRFFELMRRARSRGVALREHGIVFGLEAFRAGREEELERLYTCRIEVAPAQPPVFPRTFGQHRYVEAIRANDIALGLGPAGTGKTYLAMAMAVSSLLRGEVSRIILTRPAVEAGEALGFLPGDLYEKIMPYLRPLHDALHDMMPAEEIQRHTERGVIEIAPLAYMRGRTLNHAFIILDEAQNSTTEQMFMFLTRLGISSKAVITGDETQVDLPSHKHSGLIEAHRALRHIEGIAIIEFSRRDVVRHPLVQRIIAAYEDHRGLTRPLAPKENP